MERGLKISQSSAEKLQPSRGLDKHFQHRSRSVKITKELEK